MQAMNGDDTLQTLQVIQNLQLKLRKTSQEVHVRRQNAAKAEAALQSQASRHMSQAVLQQESMLALQEAFQERDAESARTERLISELQALQADLLVNEQNEMNRMNGMNGMNGMNEMNEMNEDERCEKAFVDIQTHELLESELHVLQSESIAAAENNASLQATLHETNEAKRRRDELIREKVIDLRETHQHQSRMAVEAKKRGHAISSRAVAEEHMRASRAQKSCAQQLLKDKADLEAQLDETYRQSSLIEHRMEGLRERNRILELQINREKLEFEMQKKEILQKMRKQSAAFRTFASLLEEPWLDGEAERWRSSLPVSNAGASSSCNR